MNQITSQKVRLDRPSECCAPACHGQAEIEFRVPLCAAHLAKVIRDYQTQVATLARALEPDQPEPAPDELERTRAVERKGQARSRRRLTERIEGRLGNASDEWVYFLAFADRVKIGYSTNLGTRLRTVPHDKVLAIIPGGMADEKRLHRQFHHLRVIGEWFTAAPDLMDHIASLPATCIEDALGNVAAARPARRHYPVTLTRVAAS